MEESIVILGAGVVGLTVAYQLALQKRYKVSVFAKSLPVDATQDYTSQYAGANWRSVCANDDFRMIALEKATLEYFRIFSESHPDLVNKCMAYDFFDPREPDVNDRRVFRKVGHEDDQIPWFKRICKDFHIVKDEDLPPGVEFGVGFDTVTINAPQYVKWLYQECLNLDVRFTVQDLRSLGDLQADSSIVINCTALGARTLFSDHNMYPTRGQTVLVKNTTDITNTYSRVGQSHLSYLIPRPGGGGLIIGGSQDPNNEDYAVDEKLAERTLLWAKTLYPGVIKPDHEFEVIKHNVGLRPSRKGGVRIESEQLGSRTVIHGYGIGGWGFQSSWGMANKISALLRESLAASEDGGSLVFTHETALAKVKKAQNLWNTKKAADVIKAYTELSRWRNRDTMLHGHAEIEVFLEAKWEKEHNYRLRKELFSYSGNRIAVEFYYEYSSTPSMDSQWHRCYGIEHWTFASDGRMRSRQMSGNEVSISREDRWFTDDDVDAVKLPVGLVSS